MSLARPEGAPGTHFAELGISPGVLKRVMNAALSRGGDDCDLFFQHTQSTSLALTDKKVNQANTHVDLGMGVRVVVGDQVGYAYSEDLREEALIAAARAAAEIARATPGRVAAEPVGRRIVDRSPVQIPWTEIGMGDRVEMVRAWERSAFARDPRVKRVDAYLQDAASVVMVVRPDGRLFQDYRPMTLGMVRCTAQSGEVKDSSGHNIASRAGMEFYDEARQELLVREAVDRTLFLLDAGKPPAGDMPVVLAAGPSAILLHEAIGHGMEADFNRKRTSIYADKLGERIASEQVTIIDDGTIENSRGAVSVDDEGNIGQRTVLVENGVLKSYIHDEISARHYGVDPTGSGRRQSFRHAPLPRMRATLMMSGPHEADEIIASVDRGLYCVSFQNGQVNIGAGDFSFYMRHGYLIEDGKLTRPVKDVNIIGNGPESLARIDMVANDMKIDDGGWTCGKAGQSVAVSQGMPTVRVSSLTVGGVG
jgi:TldD protein